MYFFKLISKQAFFLDGSREEINPSSSQGIATTLNCRTIRIGSYRYTPKEKVFYIFIIINKNTVTIKKNSLVNKIHNVFLFQVYISSKGIKIIAPTLKDESKDVALQIQLKELVRILVHFGKGLPVIFVYTMSRCGAYIRKTLDMIDDTGEYIYC